MDRLKHRYAGNNNRRPVGNKPIRHHVEVVETVGNPTNVVCREPEKSGYNRCSEYK